MPADPEKTYPTVAEQAIIDRIASGLAEVWFAQGWISQPQIKNYHEDYVVECAPDGELSGEKFSVQQKAHTHVIFSKGLASQVMETKHLIYYNEKVKMPVFLLLVDVTTKQGYYLFMQKWLDDETASEKLRQQETLTVKVPEVNRIEKSDQLLSDVRAATAYMRKKFPGSVEDAVAEEVKLLGAVDPRWDIRLNYVNAKKYYQINPKGDISASLKLPISHAEQIQEHIDYGVPLDLEGEGMSLSGSPLFDKLAKGGGLAKVEARPVNPNRMDIHLWSEGPGAFRLTLPGTVTKGRLGVCFIGQLSGAPLMAKLKMPTEDITQPKGQGIFNLSFQFERWTGKPVAILPYLDKLHDFAKAIIDGRTILHELEIDGNRVTRGHLGNPAETSIFSAAATVIGYAAKARALAQKLNLQMLFPKWDEVSVQEIEQLEIAHDILLGGEYRIVSPNISVGGRVILETGDPVTKLAEIEAVNEQGFSDSSPNQATIVFGTPVDLGELTYSVVPCRLEMAEPERTEFLTGRVKAASVRIKSGSNTAVLRIFPTQRSAN